MASIKSAWIIAAVIALEFVAIAPSFAADDCSQGNAVNCYTQALVRLQAAQDALVDARNDIKELQAEMALAAPVGSVVPMFLAPQQIANLAPTWLPADGRTVSDPSSPLNGEQLPDLTDRIVLGADPAKSVIPNDATNVNGTLSVQMPFSASGTTSGTNMFNFQGPVVQNVPPRFVVDTTVNETSSADHNHTVTVNGTLQGPLPRQPYRRLVYMVHCRP
jgi:hypothetical protein